ncbi:hypothetical protein C0J52_04707, partial [Blattella germanica]
SNWCSKPYYNIAIARIYCDKIKYNCSDNSSDEILYDDDIIVCPFDDSANDDSDSEINQMHKSYERIH